MDDKQRLYYLLQSEIDKRMQLKNQGLANAYDNIDLLDEEIRLLERLRDEQLDNIESQEYLEADLSMSFSKDR